MILRDIQRQKTWARFCQMKVNSYTEARDAEHGFCQIFNVTDTFGRDEELIYYFQDEAGALPQGENPEWFDVKWMGTYFKCIPVDPPKDAPKAGAVDWDKINLGKCRHGILCAYIQSSGLPVYVEQGNTSFSIKKGALEMINKLAEFSMTGEIK